MPSGALHYLITDFNVSEAKATKWNIFLTEHCDAANGQEERCPESGRHHYQLYFKLKVKKTRDWIKKKLEDNQVHIEVCRRPGEAYDYGGKDSTRVDGGWNIKFGERPAGQGERSDISGIIDAVKSGGLRAALEFDPKAFIKYPRGLQLANSLFLEDNARDTKTRVWVFYGPPGCGKSSLAKAISKYYRRELYVKLCSEKWFDYYDPRKHSAVLLDDFTGGIPYSQMLAICDRNQCFVEVKGGTVPWMVKDLFITSNCHPADWYKFEENKKMDRRAMERRFDFQWNGFADPNFNPEAYQGWKGVEVQGPKSPVILGGDLDFKCYYNGNGDWTFRGISDSSQGDVLIIE